MVPLSKFGKVRLVTIFIMKRCHFQALTNHFSFKKIQRSCIPLNKQEQITHHFIIVVILHDIINALKYDDIFVYIKIMKKKIITRWEHNTYLQVSWNDMVPFQLPTIILFVASQHQHAWWFVRLLNHSNKNSPIYPFCRDLKNK